MADDRNPGASQPQPTGAKQARWGRAKDFRVAYSNSFRFIRVGPNDIGIAFCYQTELPDQPLIQDEVEVVLTPITLKLLKMSIDDAVEALEKVMGTITLPPETMAALAAAKAAATESLAKTTSAKSAETEKKRK